MAASLREAARFDRSAFSLPAGLRAGTFVALPVLIGLATGQSEFIFATLGALFVTNTEGPRTLSAPLRLRVGRFRARDAGGDDRSPRHPSDVPRPPARAVLGGLYGIRTDGHVHRHTLRGGSRTPRRYGRDGRSKAGLLPAGRSLGPAGRLARQAHRLAQSLERVQRGRAVPLREHTCSPLDTRVPPLGGFWSRAYRRGGFIGRSCYRDGARPAAGLLRRRHNSPGDKAGHRSDGRLHADDRRGYGGGSGNRCRSHARGRQRLRALGPPPLLLDSPLRERGQPRTDPGLSDAVHNRPAEHPLPRAVAARGGADPGRRHRRRHICTDGLPPRREMAQARVGGPQCWRARRSV
jgi:hypothetical protein